MVGMIRKRITASTLLEVLIAMVIIMAVFTIAIKVFNNVMASGISFKKVRVHGQLDVLATEARQNGVIGDREIAIDSIVYSYSIYPSGIENLSQLEIKATENGKLLESIKCLVKNDGSHEN